jgi:hypothetical protein
MKQVGLVAVLQAFIQRCLVQLLARSPGVLTDFHGFPVSTRDC